MVALRIGCLLAVGFGLLGCEWLVGWWAFWRVREKKGRDAHKCVMSRVEWVQRGPMHLANMGVSVFAGACLCSGTLITGLPPCSIWQRLAMMMPWVLVYGAMWSFVTYSRRAYLLRLPESDRDFRRAAWRSFVVAGVLLYLMIQLALPPGGAAPVLP